MNTGKHEPKFQPPKIVLLAVEGWGKTTCGCHTIKPLMVMAEGETGYLTLSSTGQVPVVPTILNGGNKPRPIKTWAELNQLVDQLRDGKLTGFKTLVLDAIGAIQNILIDHVIRYDFDNSFDKFISFGRGHERAGREWSMFLSKLDGLVEVGIMSLILGHVKIEAFHNPEGDDYDRYQADVHKKIWSSTKRWADAVLFGNYAQITEKADRHSRAKGIGDAQRILQTQYRNTADAKNRYNMPPELDIPDNPGQAWAKIWEHIAPDEIKKKKGGAKNGTATIAAG